MINLESKITDVTVYRYGADISRIALIEKTDFSKGNAAFKITGLPLVLLDSTVKVKLISNNGGKVDLPSAKDYKIIIEEPDLGVDTVSEIDTKIEKSSNTIMKITDEIGQLDYWIKLLSESRITERHVDEKSGPVKSPLDKRMELLDLKINKATELIKKKQGKLIELNNEKKIIFDLADKKKLMTAQEKDNKDTLKKACIITLVGFSFPPDTKIKFNYMVPGACWAPSYMLHLDKDYSNAELALRAMVCQYTGEDWDNVNITLSTALPQSWTDLPELASLRIGRRQRPVKKSGYREAPVGAKELYSDFDEEFKIIVQPQTKKKIIEAVSKEIDAPMPEDTVQGFVSPVEEEVEESEELAVSMDMAFEDKVNFGASGPPPEMQAPPVMYSKSKIGGRSVRSPKLKKSVRRAKHMSPLRERKEREKSVDDRMNGFFEPEEIIASAKFLNFSKLRMPNYHSDVRGELKIITDDELYVDICQQYGLRFKEIYKNVFTLHERNAASVKTINLPDGYLLADSYNGFDYAYKADAPVDIPSNNIYHNIKVMKFDSAPEAYYVTVPRENTSVYKFISMKNKLEAPLLRGVCDIFAGGNYTATGRIKFTAPKGIIKLGLGVEQRIKVARNIKYEEEAAGIVGSNIKLEHSIVLEIRNLLDKIIKIQVRERIPISDLKPEDIKITISSTTPVWKKYDPSEYSLRGGYCWDLEIEPSKTAALKVDYSISISSKEELVDGNRREE